MNKYNKNIKLQATAKGRNDSIKRRPTTWEEKIDIVLFCISLNCDYYKTAEVHNVSYQQVNQWVRKYKSGGGDALKDGRGRNKSEEEINPR